MIADLFFDWQPGLLAWLLTFAVHSSVLLGAAWLMGRFFVGRMEALQECLWKFALSGALITSSLQLAFVVEPVGGNFVLLGPTSNSVSAVPLQPHAALLAASGDIGMPSGEAAIQAQTAFPAWAQWTLALFLGAGLLGLGAHLSRRLRLLLRLRARTELPASVAGELLESLCKRAGYKRTIRLSWHADLRTPIAFGILRPEICLPKGVSDELDEEELSGLLAHELAHLMAKDPLWLEGCSLLVALFPWQPLIRSARHRIRELSEYRCDAVAAELAGHLPLARCLVEVARWMLKPGHSLGAALLGMGTARGTDLRRRVERLLENKPRPRLGLHRFWLMPAFVLTLVGMSAAVPGAGTTLERIAKHESESIYASIDALVLLDDDCAELAREFTELQRGLVGVKLDQVTMNMVRALASKLEELDKRRIKLRKLILHSMFEELSEERSETDFPATNEDERK